MTDAIKELGNAMDLGKPWDGPLLPEPRLVIFDGRRSGKTLAAAIAACQRKNCYTKKEAKSALNAARRRGEKKLRAYPCPHCNGWHLTHK